MCRVATKGSGREVDQTTSDLSKVSWLLDCQINGGDFQVAGECVHWLQAVGEPALGFVTLDPKAVFPDYDPEFCPQDLAPLMAEPDELVLLSVVTVPSDVRQMTANLQAPLVIDPRNRLARQVIVSSPEYTTRHYVFSALSSLSQRTG